jgi:hypothetical protein
MRLCAVPAFLALAFAVVGTSTDLRDDPVQAEDAAQALVRGAAFERKAADFTSVTQVWDGRVAASVVEDAARLDEFRSTVFWLHDRVGACVSYELEALRGHTEATFDLMCQRGNATVRVHLDEGLHFDGIEVYARGVRASSQVKMALALTNGWLSWGRDAPNFADSNTEQSLRQSFERGEHCRLGKDLRVSPRGASALYICEDVYDRVLTLELDEAGRIAKAQISAAGMAS